MDRFRVGLLALVAVCAFALMAGVASAQCAVEGTPVSGQVCPSPSPTTSPDPSPDPTPSPSPKPTKTRTPRPSPSPTSTYRFDLPPLLPIPSPTPSNGYFDPTKEIATPPPSYQPIERFFATGPGLPGAPTDSDGMTGMILGLLGAGAAGAFALARARVRSWMVGI